VSGIRQVHEQVPGLLDDPGLHRAEMYNRICISDDQLLVTLSAYGVAARRQAVLHLRRADESDLVGTYLDAFDRIFAAATVALP
jgi:hypothetical protein